MGFACWRFSALSFMHPPSPSLYASTIPPSVLPRLVGHPPLRVFNHGNSINYYSSIAINSVIILRNPHTACRKPFRQDFVCHIPDFWVPRPVLCASQVLYMVSCIDLAPSTSSFMNNVAISNTKREPSQSHLELVLRAKMSRDHGQFYSYCQEFDVFCVICGGAFHREVHIGSWLRKCPLLN